MSRTAYIIIALVCGIIAWQQLFGITESDIVGRWHYSEKFGQASVQGVLAFQESGVCNLTGTAMVGKQAAAVQISGTWKLGFRKIVFDWTKCNVKNFPLREMNGAVMIKKLEDGVMSLKDKDGDVEEWRKLG